MPVRQEGNCKSNAGQMPTCEVGRRVLLARGIELLSPVCLVVSTVKCMNIEACPLLTPSQQHGPVLSRLRTFYPHPPWRWEAHAPFHAPLIDPVIRGSLGSGRATKRGCRQCRKALPLRTD